MDWTEHLISFYNNLEPPEHLPHGIDWLYPQKDPATFQTATSFFKKFYSDCHPRQILLGINPGRFGAGVTGVNFTAPKQLLEECGIEHHLGKGTELSAEFIYRMIQAFGGADVFYARYFIGSVCPLGFTRDGKNLNYYDDKDLMTSIETFIVHNISQLVSFQTNTHTAFCIGGEKNYRYFNAFNEIHHWFERIIPLPHPRFIMQYRRKTLTHFIDQYLQLLKND